MFGRMLDRQLSDQKDPGDGLTENVVELVELDDVEEGSLELARRTLVGKILTKKILNKGAVRSICSSAWGEAAEVKISNMGPNIFLFSFPTERMVKEIMLKSPWAVMSNILSLQTWNPDVAVAEIDFSSVPIWVQIHGLPLGAMTVPNATKIMKLVGEIMEIENPLWEGVLTRSFMRVRINFNTLKPLPTGCWVPRKGKPKSWIMFRYEKLQGFCFSVV